jgi:tetratricopeptide (TPR) repeat protein
MSPEQQQCVRAHREGAAIPIALDGRSDVYSLGALLFESLTSNVPPTSEKRSRELLRSQSPPISRGLEDVLQKCLAPDRNARYADAGELAADLRRHLANLPLRGVANRSLGERWQKWRRRKPQSLNSWFVGLTALAAIGGACLFLYSDRVKTARSALKQAEQNLADGDFGSAIGRLEIGSQAIRWLPGQDELRQSLQADFAAVRRARVVGALHELVEQLRFMDNVDGIPPAKVRELDADCRAIWETRSQIAAARPSHTIGKEDGNDIDLLDLALMWTRLISRDSAKGDIPDSAAQSSTILAETEKLLGSSPALTLARLQLTDHSFSADQYAALISKQPPRTAWECDAIGRSLLQAGRLTQALDMFEQAIQLEPGSFWPNFHLATCAYRCKRFDEALRAACVCVALSSKRAECFFNRGLCFRAVGQNEAALCDFGRAIELEPALGTAALERGTLLAEMEHPAEALENLNRAATLVSEPSEAYYQMALIHVRQHELTAARECIKQSLQSDSTYAPARSLQAQLESGGATQSPR